MSVLTGGAQRLPAHELLPGDFTTLSGFRHVVDVAPVYASYGRGRKRVVDKLVGVDLARADGTLDRVGPDDVLTVYREAG